MASLAITLSPITSAELDATIPTRNKLTATPTSSKLTSSSKISKDLTDPQALHLHLHLRHPSLPNLLHSSMLTWTTLSLYTLLWEVVFLCYHDRGRNYINDVAIKEKPHWSQHLSRELTHHKACVSVHCVSWTIASIF